MSISAKQVRNFLFSNGFVYTFRTRKRKRVGKDWIRKRKKSALKIADVYIEFIRQVKSEKEATKMVNVFNENSDSGWKYELRPSPCPKETDYPLE